MTNGEIAAIAARWGKTRRNDDMSFVQLREQAAHDIAALLAVLRVEQTARERAEATLAYLDRIIPRADASCDEPGITVSEAVRRAMEGESE